jgi:hypothetical protein
MNEINKNKETVIVRVDIARDIWRAFRVEALKKGVTAGRLAGEIIEKWLEEIKNG